MTYVLADRDVRFASFSVPGDFMEADVDILEKVIDTVSEELGVDRSAISAESEFVKDLNADSLDLVELIMSLEEKFDISIPDELTEKIKTVGDVAEMISKEKGNG